MKKRTIFYIIGIIVILLIAGGLLYYFLRVKADTVGSWSIVYHPGYGIHAEENHQRNVKGLDVEIRYWIPAKFKLNPNICGPFNQTGTCDPRNVANNIWYPVSIIKKTSNTGNIGVLKQEMIDNARASLQTKVCSSSSSQLLCYDGYIDQNANNPLVYTVRAGNQTITQGERAIVWTGKGYINDRVQDLNEKVQYILRPGESIMQDVRVW